MPSETYRCCDVQHASYHAPVVRVHTTSHARTHTNARRKGKREYIMALETLKDLFQSQLLPDRKLKSFHEQMHLQHPNVDDK